MRSRTSCTVTIPDGGIATGSAKITPLLCRARGGVQALLGVTALDHAVVDPLGERCSHVDARVRAGDDPDDEREHEVLDYARAEDEKREDAEHRRSGREDRARERLAHA